MATSARDTAAKNKSDNQNSSINKDNSISKDRHNQSKAQSARDIPDSNLNRNKSGIELARNQSDIELIRNLSDIQLIRRIERCDTKERELTLTILHHLGELDRRRLYLRQGYSSLFDFCLRHLNYSEAAAGRRIRAARAIRDYPEVAARYESREVSVTTISRIAGIITKKNCGKLLDAVAGRRKNDVEMVVSRFRPRDRIIEKVKPVFVLAAVPEDSLVEISESSTGKGESSLDPALSPQDPSDSSQDPALSSQDPSDSSMRFDALTGYNIEVSPEGGRSSTTAGGGKNSCSLDGDPFGDDRVADRPGDEQKGRDCADPGCGGTRRKILTQRLKYRLEFGIDPDLMDKIEKVKSLLSTKYPGNVSLEQLLAELIDEYLDRHSPEARKARREKRIASKEDPETKETPAHEHEPSSEHDPSRRHIPKHIRDEIYSRDGGRCSFVGPDGIRCGSKWNVQIDHIRPFSKGGDHSPENLRLLCARHNRFEAERHLGIGMMKKFRKRE